MMVALAYKRCIGLAINSSKIDDSTMNSSEKFSLTRIFTTRLFWKFFAAILLAQVAATLAIGAAIWWKNSQNTKTESQLIDTSPRASESIDSAEATLQFGGEAALIQLLQQMRHHRVMVVDLGGAKDKDIAGRELKKNVLEEALQQLQSNSEQEGKEASVRRLEIKGKSYLLFLPRPDVMPSRGLHEVDHMLPMIGQGEGKGPREENKIDRQSGFHPPPNDRAPHRNMGTEAPPPIDGNLQRDPRPPNDAGFEKREMRPREPNRKPDFGRDLKGPPRNSAITPWIMVGAAILVSLTFAAFLAWIFTRPLMALQQAFEQAAQGNLEPRFTKPQHWIDDELHQLGRRFDHMASRLRAVMEQQTKLMHDVSHELRSPLARIQAAIGLIHQQPERTLTYVDRIERESGRMDHLIEELLTLARLEAGALPQPQEFVAMSEIVDAMIDDLRFEAEQHAQQIEYQVMQDFETLAQFDLIARAIENVVRNAIKYSPAQSVIRIEIDLQAMGVVNIYDQGPGVPEAELDSIFHAFFRSQLNSSLAAGHGLGLAIARQIIHHSRGSISAMNRPQGGLLVSIRLPAQALAPR